MAVDSIARGMASRALTEVGGLEVDSGIPAMSTATADKYLSNDGTSAVWVDAPEADKIVPEFLITLTEGEEDGVYTADKTYNQIKAAYDAGHPLIVLVGNGRLPMLNGEINEDGAGFTFGYTEVRTGGDYIVTRSVHYLHTSTEDLWTDNDATGEYLKKTDAANLVHYTAEAQVVVNETPTENEHAASKKYVDEAIAGINQTVAGVFTYDESTKTLVIKTN